MKKAWLGVVAAAACITGPAFAADMPVKMPLKAAPMGAAYNWSGFYVGAYVGGTWDPTSIRYFDTVGPIGQNNPLTPRGAVFGALAGVNKQFDRWVLGLELEYGGSTAKQSAVAFTTASFTQEDKSTSQGRARARVGYAFDNVLPFVAGGFSFADRNTLTLTEAGLAIPTVSMSHTHQGGNIGGGVDYGFTKNVIGRVEYIYDRYDEINYGFIALTGDVWSDRHVRPTSNTVRGALIVKFDGP